MAPSARARVSVVLALVTALTGLTACAASAPAASAPARITASDIAAMAPVEVVDTLEALPVDERPSDVTVSVRPDRLVITADGAETERPLPEDLFYLSLAPYVDQTHDCFFHSLTTCLGELGGAALDVTVTDSSGVTLVDETVTAADNGFVGLWLPRGIDATLEVAYDGARATTPISTGAEDPTCLTGLHLS
ncbi:MULTISPECIES: CueP family metal-binding protein [Microbacterium]|nr:MULTISPECIES: CueP family metal-binding protein [Microbacterium]